MRYGVTASWRRLPAGPPNHADCGHTHTAELLPLLAEEERPRDAGEDDGCMVATPSQSAATLDLPGLLQMGLP
jgi:hypothetical protein